MDWFSLGLAGLSVAAQGVLHPLFTCRLGGKPPKIWYFFAYLALLCLIQLSTLRDGIAVLMQLTALYGINRLAAGSPRADACAAALLAVYIWRLSVGLVSAAESLIFSPRLVGGPLYAAVLLAELLAAALCACCYALVLKLLSAAGDSAIPCAGLLLFPGLFFFCAEQYVIGQAYSPSHAPVWADAGGQLPLLLLQLLGLGAMLCTLYACGCACRGFASQASLASLAQAVQAQRAYVAEAQARYRKTRAFRHDIRNHLSVLRGLLHSGKTGEAERYLARLEADAAPMSLPCQTGHPAVDVLLGEKLAWARANGIKTELSLCLPIPCGIDGFDLCVVFANALDNAVTACLSAGGERSIRIGGERQGDFLMLEFENTCAAGPLPPAGDGLSNIRTAAEKYQGAVLAEKEGCRFRLHVLMNISIPADGSSRQKPCNTAQGR